MSNPKTNRVFITTTILALTLFGCVWLYSFLREAGIKDAQHFQGAARNLTLDNQGNVYVYSNDTPAIEKLSNSGQYLAKWGLLENSNGSSGDIDPHIGNFQSGITTDSHNNVFVADADNSSIQKFDSNGKFLFMWGTQGSGDGQLKQPSGIAIDTQGNVYVTDIVNNRIEKFDPNGNFVAKWGSAGSGGGQFKTPTGIALDSHNNMYIADSGNQRIEKLDSNGNFLAVWNGGNQNYFNNVNYTGNPRAIAVDNKDNIYVTKGDGIVVFDSNGNVKRILDNLVPNSSIFILEDSIQPINNVAVDKEGNIYIAEDYVLPTGYNQIDDYSNPNGYYNPHVEKFDRDGNFLAAYQPNAVNVDIPFWVWLIVASPLLPAIAVWLFKSKAKN